MRVMILHSTPIVHAGLEAALNAHSDFQIIPAARSCAMVSASDVPEVTVVVADCEWAIRLARLDKSSLWRVVVVTEDQSEASLRRAIEAGVRGYLSLSCDVDAVVHAVRRVHDGDTVLDPALVSRVVNSLSADPLTAREADVLRLLMRGLPNKAIARRLAISLGTVKAHVKALLRKLDAGSRTEAAAIARRRGIVSELEVSTLSHDVDREPAWNAGSEVGQRRRASHPARRAFAQSQYPNAQPDGAGASVLAALQASFG